MTNSINDLITRLEKRAYTYGPSITHDLGNGLSIATADLKKTIIDQDIHDALVKIWNLENQIDALENARWESEAGDSL